MNLLKHERSLFLGVLSSLRLIFCSRSSFYSSPVLGGAPISFTTIANYPPPAELTPSFVLSWFSPPPLFVSSDVMFNNSYEITFDYFDLTVDIFYFFPGEDLTSWVSPDGLISPVLSSTFFRPMLSSIFWRRPNFGPSGEAWNEERSIYFLDSFLLGERLLWWSWLL